MHTTRDDASIPTPVPLSEVVSVKRRFLRSINLERDFYTADPLDGYVLTASAISTLGRLGLGVNNAYSRAISITGPYGSGKSAFALFAARSLSLPGMGSLEPRSRLRHIEPVLARTVFPRDDKGYWPILITGSRQQIGSALLAGLMASLNKIPGAAAKSVTRSLRNKWGAALSNKSPSSSEITGVFAEASRLARSKDPSCEGLFVVLDEAGKYLEYAALHPENTDVHILQELAELASRSDVDSIFLVTILHQSFDEYAYRLTHAQREEWQKVQGRFTDTPFGDSPDETLHLIGQAIQHRTDAALAMLIEQELECDLIACQSIGIVPNGSSGEFKETLKRTYPLHPVSLCLLPHAFRRFGQSERSLFSFLSLDEPHGFQEFLREKTLARDLAPQLRIDQLYDYLVSSLSSALYSHATAKTWSEAEESLFRLREGDDLQRRVLKAIGLLQALGEQTRILPTKEVLRFALCGYNVTYDDVDTALAALEARTLITYRQFRKCYRLYEGSDIDVDARFREARSQFAHGTDCVSIASRLGLAPPIVARRHSFETGTFRFFDVRHCRPATLRSEIASGCANADGLIMLCIAANDAERFDAISIAQGELATQGDVIVGVTVETDALNEAAVAVRSLEWLYENTPELINDKVAAREVRERRYDAERAFATEWDRLLRPRNMQDGGAWYYQGQQSTLRSYRDLQALVSKACDEAYPQTPILKNELVNRKQLSSTSAAARRNLIQAMLENSAIPRLGIVGFPPEASMYSSVLELTGIHRFNNGIWGMHPPDYEVDPALSEVWKQFECFIFEGRLEPKPLPELIARLKARPYGIADGIIPVLLCAVLLNNANEVALYEEGRFIVDLDIATFERLMKRPEDYKLQGCRIAGERQAVLDRFSNGLLREGEDRTLVNVVRQMYRVFNKLPEYTVKTRQLDDTAKAVRDLFRESREPENLLFTDLPSAFGAEAFVKYEANPQNLDFFFEQWNSALRTITTAYGKLLDSIQSTLCLAFATSDWEELSARAANIVGYITDSRLRSFAGRAADITLDRGRWLESVSSVVAGRAPFQWSDAESERFANLLPPIVDAFRHSELLYFEKRQVSAEDQIGVRLAITTDHGQEHAGVSFTAVEDQGRIDKLVGQLSARFQEVLKGEPHDVRIAVLSHFARTILQGQEL